MSQYNQPGDEMVMMNIISRLNRRCWNINTLPEIYVGGGKVAEKWDLWICVCNAIYPKIPIWLIIIAVWPAEMLNV